MSAQTIQMMTFTHSYLDTLQIPFISTFRGHPGVQKHYRATSTILAIQMCYVGNRILKATKGVHY